MKNSAKKMSKAQSRVFVKNLLKNKQTFIPVRDCKVGALIFTGYDAKFDKLPFDKRPLFLVLRSNARYTLGLNFHWLPISMRVWLIRFIIRKNKKRKNENLLAFTYKELRPLLKKLKYAPCIRLYINSNFAQSCAIIPPKHLLDAALLDTSVFSGISAERAYALRVKNKKR